MHRAWALVGDEGIPGAASHPGGALALLQARAPIGMRLGLSRMRALLRQLGDPQRSLGGALIGGTNGKGSTQAMVGAMLRAAGRTVGQAPSPHLSDYRERIVIDGEPISANDLDRVLRAALAASDRGERRHGPATEFELLMAAAFLRFAERAVDVAVVEVGLGGRLDATNTWDGGVAVITNVGLDHQEQLGPTLAGIAREKAAIIKVGDRAVTGATGVALTVLRRRARRLRVPLRECAPLPVESLDREGMVVRAPGLGRLRLHLLGRHQAHNASIALGTVEALGEAGIARVGDAAIRRGLESALWPGRLEPLVAGGVTIVLDGAHNPDGAAVLAATLDELRASLPAGPATLLLGILRDKEVSAILEALTGSRLLRSAALVATRVPGTERALDATSLAAAWKAATARATRHAPAAEPAPSPVAVHDASEALDAALRLARERGGPLVVAGSLYLVGDVRRRLLGSEEGAAG